MEDNQIIELYQNRSEEALQQTKIKYNSYLKAIALNILHNDEDCEECINDTYLSAWNQIPPDKPASLLAYLGKIVRCISIDVYRRNKAKKRYDNMTVLLSELEECMPDIPDTSLLTDSDDIKDSINRWLRSLDTEKRVLFVRRYWHGYSLNELAAEFGMSHSKLASLMLRLRKDLRNYLKKEGIDL